MLYNDITFLTDAWLSSIEQNIMSYCQKEVKSQTATIHIWLRNWYNQQLQGGQRKSQSRANNGKYPRFRKKIISDHLRK